MNRLGRTYRLVHKLVVSAVMAFLASAVLFVVLQSVTYRLIEDYCASPEVVAVHLQKKVDSLQRYITDHNIALSETNKLDEWKQTEDLTELAVYYENNLLYSSFMVFPKISPRSQIQNETLKWSNGYPLTFRDGEARGFIKHLFEHRYTDLASYLNLVAFFLCFITIMVFFIHGKVSYISILEREVQLMEGGDLTHSITIRGNDELAALGQGINEMRKKFIERAQYAERLNAASNELVTGISHDLRTPLTALIGYLEVMEEETFPPRQSSSFEKCKNRAFQIKGLIDDLFKYFYMSYNGPERFELCTRTAKEALEEVIGERVFLIEQLGFCIENRIDLPGAAIQTNQDMMQRIFDNLFSNIQRYADPAHTIRLQSVVSKHELTITIENTILETPQYPQNTRLGLKNCEKLMQICQGRFAGEKKGNLFIVQLFFPLI